MTHPDDVALAAALPAIRSAPADDGSVALDRAPPRTRRARGVDEGVLDPAVGLVGDSWSVRPSRSTPDGTADPAAQLTVMSVRAADIVATGADAPTTPGARRRPALRRLGPVRGERTRRDAPGRR
ncbi:MAG: hypothetical protein R2699_12305 [Acidimicrobiales bacterium]